MKTNYILIDYENVQPDNLSLLRTHSFQIKVFVGQHQTRIPLSIASCLQSFGNDAEYIQIEGNGPNALDFHIAFYIGLLASNNPNSFFHIISKDAGFDPLIKYLKTKRIYAQRHRDISDISLVKVSNVKTVAEKVDAVITDLLRRKHSKPRKLKTLSNTINAIFVKQLSETDLKEIIKEIEHRNLITISEDNISYHLKEC